MAIDEQLLEIIETLEAIRFLTHSWIREPETVLAQSGAALATMNRDGRLRLRGVLRSQLSEVRSHYGALAFDGTLRGMLAEARQQKGYVYLPKRFIDMKLFSRFDRVFSRWSFMPPHALVVYDPHTHRPLNSIYQAEIELYRDAQHMLSRAKAYCKDTADFRKRDPSGCCSPICAQLLRPRPDSRGVPKRHSVRLLY